MLFCLFVVATSVWSMLVRVCARERRVCLTPMHVYVFSLSPCTGRRERRRDSRRRRNQAHAFAREIARVSHKACGNPRGHRRQGLSGIGGGVAVPSVGLND